MFGGILKNTLEYFLVFGCVLENTIENTFSTYLLLTFSQFPNKYIISFLNRETHKKQNPKKKNSSNSVKLREEGSEREVTGFDIEVRSCNRGEGEHDQTRFIGDGFEHNGGAEVARSDQR